MWYVNTRNSMWVRTKHAMWKRNLLCHNILLIECEKLKIKISFVDNPCNMQQGLKSLFDEVLKWLWPIIVHGSLKMIYNDFCWTQNRILEVLTIDGIRSFIQNILSSYPEKLIFVPYSIGVWYLMLILRVTDTWLLLWKSILGMEHGWYLILIRILLSNCIKILSN